MKPAEKYRAWKAHRPEKPIFRTILFSMMAVLLAEVILLSTGIGLTNVSGRLNQNAKQIVNMQVRNRASYLQDMLIKAQELTDISTTINNLTQQMLQDGTISLDTMDQSSEAADPLMEAAAPYLVSALRARPCLRSHPAPRSRKRRRNVPLCRRSPRRRRRTSRLGRAAVRTGWRS